MLSLTIRVSIRTSAIRFYLDYVIVYICQIKINWKKKTWIYPDYVQCNQFCFLFSAILMYVMVWFPPYRRLVYKPSTFQFCILVLHGFTDWPYALFLLTFWWPLTLILNQCLLTTLVSFSYFPSLFLFSSASWNFCQFSFLICSCCSLS